MGRNSEPLHPIIKIKSCFHGFVLNSRYGYSMYKSMFTKCQTLLQYGKHRSHAIYKYWRFFHCILALWQHLPAL